MQTPAPSQPTALDIETRRTIGALETERKTILDRQEADAARLSVIDRQLAALAPPPAEAGAPAQAPAAPEAPVKK